MLVIEIGRYLSGHLLPFLKVLISMPDERDRIKIADEKRLEICFVLYSTFESMLSGPPNEGSFTPWITCATRSGEITMSGMGG